MARKKKLGPKLPELAMVEPLKRSSSVRISGPEARKVMAKMAVGKKHRFTVGGKVRSISSNEFDDSIEMDMDHCEHCEEPKSLTQAMKSRHKNRHMRSGRFV